MKKLIIFLIFLLLVGCSQIEKSDETPLLDKGFRHYELSEYELAIDCFINGLLDGEENPLAYQKLGIMYKNGYGTEVNLDKAIEYYELAIMGNDAGSMNNLGVMYLNGEGVILDYDKARELFEKGSALGYDMCYYNLGMMYENGLGVSIDYNKAISYYEQCDNVLAYEALGRIYNYNLANGEKAVEYYLKVIDESSNAAYELGKLYDEGKLVQEDVTKAYDYYLLAADNGNGDAYDNLGYLYEIGRFVIQDKNMAKDYYQKAAELNCAYGFFDLGRCYEYGIGIDIDLDKAMSYYEIAYTLGVNQAKEKMEELD